MATQTLQGALKTGKDKYRSFLHHEDAHNTVWRRGAPPTYDNVNKLFEEGRTKACVCVCCVLVQLEWEWAEGSLEETVQNMMKSWQMELTHKTRTQDFKTMHPEKFKFIVNDEFKYYKAHEETFDSADDAFRTALPRGFRVKWWQFTQDRR
ncbi:UNVERIFIED_CONTAM: Pathogen-related protein [Sesamum calycinum]|uniref:Pathogen-related protein n=1 Tax=Sesamum calycinum TaxID=2727403 RepID=A0AAW2J4R6_9LAMI